MNWMVSKMVAFKTPGRAQGEPAYCLCGARHKGGVNLIQALMWNVGTYCMMLRENPISGGPTKGESIDAYSRGGPSRTSGEVHVMRMERRGWASLPRGACQP